MTAWCSVRRSNSVSAPASLAPTSHACGTSAGAAVPSAACARTGSASARPSSSPPGGEAAARAVADALAQLRAQLVDGLVGQRLAVRAAHELRAARVEDQRRAADQRGERGGHAVEPALGEHDPLEPLVRGDRPLEHRVVLVDRCEEAFSVTAMNGTS